MMILDEQSEAVCKAIECAPAGTAGLVCEPWTAGEVYGVAADWSDASSPVFAYGADGWFPTSRQVADSRHSARAALVEVLCDSLRMSGEGDESDDIAESLADDAVHFSAGE